jgi:hypothetical protein
VKLFVADLQRLEELVRACMHGGFSEVLGVFRRQYEEYQGGGAAGGGRPTISKTPQPALPPGQTRFGCCRRR